MPPEATIHATAYAVCVIPEDNINHRLYAVTVERIHHTGTWAVRWMGRCLGEDGTWEYEPIQSERTDEWLAAHRFILPTALFLARLAARDITVNGVTVADILARTEARS
jgi:hypothetical protein